MNDRDSLEVELKFRVKDEERLIADLKLLMARELEAEHHIDTYYQHPCRDFRQTKEALRLRRINGHPYVTYKGPKLPGEVKVRRELEWCLSPSDAMGELTEELWRQLGFTEVAVVNKIRRPFALEYEQRNVLVTIDTVQRVGMYTEIEIITDVAGMESARDLVLRLAEKLGVSQPEPRSYLSLLLVAQGLETPDYR